MLLLHLAVLLLNIAVKSLQNIDAAQVTAQTDNTVVLRETTVRSTPVQAAQAVTTATTDNASILRETEVRSAPMSNEHKDLVISHILRLNKIIYAATKRDIGRYTDRNTAIRQLARMNVVFRRYMHKHSLGEFKSDDGTNYLPESMVADIVDASFSVDTAARTAGYAVIGAIHYDGDHGVDFGEEQECEHLVQEILAESADQAAELWLVRTASKGETTLPDGVDKDELGKDVDFDYFYAADASDDENYFGKDSDFVAGLPKEEDLPKKFCIRRYRKMVDFGWDEDVKPDGPKEFPKEFSIRKKKEKVDIRWS